MSQRTAKNETYFENTEKYFSAFKSREVKVFYELEIVAQMETISDFFLLLLVTPYTLVAQMDVGPIK